VSRATVRAALATFLQGANITGLNGIYKAKPTFYDGAQLDAGGDNGSAAWAWVDLGDSDETRLSVPAQWPGQTGAGDKAVHYDAAIVVEYQFLIRSAQIASTAAPDAWVDGEDAIIQAIKDRLHSDPALGNAAVVLASGQENRGMHVTGDDPLREPGKIVSIKAISFRITEIIQA
jgi:hypothetical protein